LAQKLEGWALGVAGAGLVDHRADEAHQVLFEGRVEAWVFLGEHRPGVIVGAGGIVLSGLLMVEDWLPPVPQPCSEEAQSEKTPWLPMILQNWLSRAPTIPARPAATCWPA
jgi:hypothetical protein